MSTINRIGLAIMLIIIGNLLVYLCVAAGMDQETKQLMQLAFIANGAFIIFPSSEPRKGRSD